MQDNDYALVAIFVSGIFIIMLSAIIADLNTRVKFLEWQMHNAIMLVDDLESHRPHEARPGI